MKGTGRGPAGTVPAGGTADVEAAYPLDFWFSPQCSTGTLDYILQRCQLALQNVRDGAGSGDVSLKSLEPAVLKQGEEIHNEVRSLKSCEGSEIRSYRQTYKLICHSFI